MKGAYVPSAMESDPSPPQAPHKPRDESAPADANRAMSPEAELAPERARLLGEGERRTKNGQGRNDVTSSEAANPVFQQALEILRREMPAGEVQSPESKVQSPKSNRWRPKCGGGNS